MNCQGPQQISTRHTPRDTDLRNPKDLGYIYIVPRAQQGYYQEPKGFSRELAVFRLWLIDPQKAGRGHAGPMQPIQT